MISATNIATIAGRCDVNAKLDGSGDTKHVCALCSDFNVSSSAWHILPARIYTTEVKLTPLSHIIHIEASYFYCHPNRQESQLHQPQGLRPACSHLHGRGIMMTWRTLVHLDSKYTLAASTTTIRISWMAIWMSAKVRHSPSPDDILSLRLTHATFSLVFGYRSLSSYRTSCVWRTTMDSVFPILELHL